MKKIYIDKKVLTLLCAILLIGFTIFYFTYKFTVSDQKKELLEKTEIVHSSISIDDLKTLTGTPSDYDLPEYHRLRTQLQGNLEKFDVGHKNLYIMAESASKEIIFIIDLERNPLTHEVMWVPTVGKVYHETGYIRKNIFDHPHPASFVEGPFKDEFGIWISAIVPIKDTKSGETLGIVGIDYTSIDWQWTIARKLLYSVLLDVLVFLMIILAYQLAKVNQITQRRSERIKRQREVLKTLSMSDAPIQPEIADTIANLIKSLAQTVSAEEGSVWLLSPDMTSFICKSVYSAEQNHYLPETNLKIADFFYFISYLDKSHIISADDVSKDTILADFFSKLPDSATPKSVMFVAFKHQRQTIGIIALATFKRYKSWHNDEESFAQIIASIASQAISQYEKEMAKIELQTEKQRFEDTLESITDGYIYCDQHKQIKYINRHIYAILKLDMMGIDLENIWERLPDEIASLLHKLIDDATTQGTNIEHTEYLSSIDKWIEFRLYPTKNDVSLFCADVTKKKESEKAMLENQRLSAIEDMANGFAHDFNNFLQIILSNVEVLNQKLLLRADTYENLNRIQLTSKDAMTRVQILERFAGTKNKDTEYENVDVNLMINEAILQSTAIWKIGPEKEGIHYQINKNLQDVPEILGNDSELRSVLYMLIKNSVEAMPTGGQINITSGANETGVYIRITDTGEGMSPEIAKRAFEPFFTTRGYSAGKGLGLCSVWNIISEHKGTVQITSTKVGAGTTIEICLPIPTLSQTPDKEASTPKPKPKILWVDDDDFIRQIGQEMFEIMGYQIDVAEGGEHALAMLASEHYDILLSDIGMPNMNGWQLMKTVDDLYPDKFKRVLISGWGDQYSNDQRKLHKIDKIITKPVKIQQLQKLMEDIW